MILDSSDIPKCKLILRLRPSHIQKPTYIHVVHSGRKQPFPPWKGRTEAQPGRADRNKPGTHWGKRDLEASCPATELMVDSPGSPFQPCRTHAQPLSRASPVPHLQLFLADVQWSWHRQHSGAFHQNGLYLPSFLQWFSEPHCRDSKSCHVLPSEVSFWNCGANLYDLFNLVESVPARQCRVTTAAESLCHLRVEPDPALVRQSWKTFPLGF